MTNFQKFVKHIENQDPEFYELIKGAKDVADIESIAFEEGEHLKYVTNLDQFFKLEN